jgi:DNA invertase Pin-like site-specific DNA recombinase
LSLFTIISAFAKLERDIIRERTMPGLERARVQGKKAREAPAIGKGLQEARSYGGD